MRNKSIRNLVLAGAFSAVLGAGSVAAQGLGDVEIVSHDLGNGFYMLMGAGGNIGVSVGDDGIFLIDDQYAPVTDKIMAKLSELGGGPVKYILNTHWHGDHTGGNEQIGGTGAVIVAHKNVRVRMSTDQFSRLRNSTTPASAEATWPVVTFDGNVDFHFNGNKIEVMSVERSHTDGDSIVFIKKANVLHMGDTFFNTWYPYVDVDSGGSARGMIAVLARGLALANDDTKIIPGHGPFATKADMQATHDKLVAAVDVLQAGIDGGKSDADIIASNPLEPLNLEWGGFLSAEAFMTIVLGDLRG